MAPGNPIRALIFDIGHVIVRVHVNRAAAALAVTAARRRAGAAVTRQNVLDVISSDPRMVEFQEGRLTAEEWHAHVVRTLGLEVSCARFTEIWNSALDPEPILKDDFFAQLAGGYRLVLLSNTDPIHVAHMEGTYSFPRFFPHKVYSCAVGLRKPSAEIYARAINLAGAAPGEILYIDDIPEYVSAGRAQALHTHRFTDAAALFHELRERGILPAGL